MAGQALQEGKVFYHPRVKVDKSHNQVDYAFMQQMPSDWVKIVGFNNVSKYTVSFNLFYFLQPGTAQSSSGNLLTRTGGLQTSGWTRGAGNRAV